VSLVERAGVKPIRPGFNCDSCEWQERCDRDRICWQAEKQQIELERQARSAPAQPTVEITETVQAVELEAGNGDSPRRRGPKPVWTRDRILEAIRQWTAGHDGQPPATKDWRRKTPAAGYPSTTVVYRLFGSWNSAILAAGFEPTPLGRHRGRRAPADPEPEPGLELGLAPSTTLATLARRLQAAAQVAEGLDRFGSPYPDSANPRRVLAGLLAELRHVCDQMDENERRSDGDEGR
jgi:hypothetical protein